MAISQIILIQRALAVRFKTLVIGSQCRTHGGQLKNTVTFFFFFWCVPRARHFASMSQITLLVTPVEKAPLPSFYR